MQKPKIVVVEDHRPYWIALCRLLETHDYITDGVLVCRCDTCEGVVRAIQHEDPDMILMDEMLTGTLKGDDVLKALGGEFYKPGMVGGNPRVISISSDPSDGTLELVGDSFTRKDSLPGSGAELLNKVDRCNALIPEKV